MVLNTNEYISEAMRQHDNEEYYKTLQKELTSDHEYLISQCINELINNRDLDK